MASVAITPKFASLLTGKLHTRSLRTNSKQASVFSKSSRRVVQTRASGASVSDEQKLSEAFHLLALRNDDVVSRNELVTALRNTPLSEAGVVAIMAKMDDDRSGFIDEEEFKHFFADEVFTQDTNKAWAIKDNFGLAAQTRYMKTLHTRFPDSDLQEDFVAAMTKTLAAHNFTRDNAIQMISLCRDEITRDLVEELDSLWGQSFNISSLAGLVLCGCTSFKAAMSHAPELEGGKEKYVFTVAPHVAVDEDGTVGLVRRRGRSAVSSACGALIAYHNEISTGTLNLQQNPLDIEMSLLRSNLSTDINAHKMAGMSLSDVTHAAAEVIQKQLEQIVAEVIPAGSNKDYAVVSGIQIHGPEGRGFFWVQDMYEVTDGVRTELMDEYRAESASRVEKHASLVWAIDKLSVYGVSEKLNTLKEAILAKDLNKTRLLVESGLPLSAKDASGSTLLHIAAKTGDLGMVIYFVSKLVNLNDLDANDKTPLDVALEAGHEELAKYMEAVGCRKTQLVRRTILVS